eukprot:1473019-Amphidinium_carterae.1
MSGALLAAHTQLESGQLAQSPMSAPCFEEDAGYLPARFSSSICTECLSSDLHAGSACNARTQAKESRYSHHLRGTLQIHEFGEHGHFAV